jgi:hypothetical protein
MDFLKEGASSLKIIRHFLRIYAVTGSPKTIRVMKETHWVSVRCKCKILSMVNPKRITCEKVECLNHN